MLPEIQARPLRPGTSSAIMAGMPASGRKLAAVRFLFNLRQHVGGVPVA